MHILAISGSPRGGLSNTRRLLDRVLEGARSGGAETELVDLGTMHIDYCIACGTCYVTGKCSRKDDFAALYEKMLASDGLVLGSPVYFSSVTAQLKTVIDRLSDAIHCQLFLGKYACSVATAGGQDTATVGYMNDVLLRLGCTVVGVGRQGYMIALPTPDTVLYPRDRVLLLGTGQQVAAAKKFLLAVSGLPSAA